MELAFTRKLGAGLFGGEGFILQRLRGDGLAFIHIGGTVIRKDLAPGETYKVDTGCVAAFTENVTYDITWSRDFKNALFGGEGVVLATLTGPGTVYMQSLPFSRLADRIFAASAYGQNREERSGIGGSDILGGLLGGDKSF
ncbi:Mitochondrial biogenesis AIM24 [anaerobic digester metagenome]